MLQQWNLDREYFLFPVTRFCDSLITISAFALDSSYLPKNNYYGTLVNNVVENIESSIIALIKGKSLMSSIITN